jgi:endo-1,4-beta-mannosidase
MSEENQTPEAKSSYDKEFVEKLLTEKKNAMKGLDEIKSKLSAYEAQIKEVEEQRLKEKEDFKTIAQIKEKESIEWKAKYGALEAKLQTSAKLGAIKKEFEKMGLRDAKAVDMLLNLVRSEHLKYDEENQIVIGAEDEARRIKESIPMVFAANASKMNHDAANATPGALSVEGLQDLIKSKAPMHKIKEYQSNLMQELAKK